MAKKKLTLSEAKMAGHDLSVFIELEGGREGVPQKLFDERPDRRVSFPTLVNLSVKKAEKAEWKGYPKEVEVDGKKKKVFAVTITEQRMAALLGEAEEIINTQPVSSETAGKAIRRVHDSVSFLAERNHFADFSEARRLFNEAMGLLKEKIRASGGKPSEDYREVVTLAEKAEYAAKMAVVANLKKFAAQLADELGELVGDDYETLDQSLVEGDDLDKQRKLLVAFVNFAKNMRKAMPPRQEPKVSTTETIGSIVVSKQQPSGPPPEKRNGRRRPVGRHGIRDLSDVDFHEEFGVDKSVAGTCRY